MRDDYGSRTVEDAASFHAYHWVGPRSAREELLERYEAEGGDACNRDYEDEDVRRVFWTRRVIVSSRGCVDVVVREAFVNDFDKTLEVGKTHCFVLGSSTSCFRGNGKILWGAKHWCVRHPNNPNAQRALGIINDIINNLLGQTT